MPEWRSFQAFLTAALQTDSSEQRQQMVDTLLQERPQWPWIEANRATFVFNEPGTQAAAVNLDIIKDDPPFHPMANLPGTTLWYAAHAFAPDDLLDYMLAINDPMTPLAGERDLVGRISRHWRVDPLNPLRLETPQISVSVLRMPQARPFADWAAMPNVPRGRVIQHERVDSRQLGFKGRKLWVYTPPGYRQDANPDDEYPLLILHDALWCTGPLQVPYIADALIKHGQMQPVVIAMVQSGTPDERAREYAANDRHYTFLLTELLPFVQTHYRIDPTSLGVGGVDLGGVAAAHAALMNPVVFERLVMVSPPLDKGPFEAQLAGLVRRFEQQERLPERVFQSVGRHEAAARFVNPARALRAALEARAAQRDLDYRFVELGTGHGLVGYRAALPEALAWAFPGPAAQP